MLRGHILACCFLVAHLASALDAAAQSKPSETDPPPSCLDQSITDELGQKIRPRGVQERVFQKSGRFQLLVRGGIYASDMLSTTYDYGGAVGYFLSEDFGIEVGVDITPVALELDKPISDFFGDRPFDGGLALRGMVNFLWSPVHFKVKTGGGNILHGDAMFTLGAGRLFHDTTQGIAFNTGMAIQFYANRWIAVRLDLRDVLLVQETVTETRLTNNIVALFGVGFWLPFGF